MNWLETILDQLAESPCCGYWPDHTPASEVTALAALALIGHGRREQARPALRCLQQLQDSSGAVRIRSDQPQPGWPASLATLAWTAAEEADYDEPVARAVGWMLRTSGETSAREPLFGHDPSLRGWPWVVGTHSWLEPTALHVIALRARDWHSHPRVQEARRLLLDRLLPGGGCNYGNTTVLGQLLRPHLQPSGLLLLALGGEPPDSAGGAVGRTVQLLKKRLGSDTPAASLSWGLLGLAAHQQFPAAAGNWLKLAAVAARRRGASPHRLALLAVAAQGASSPLVELLKGPLS